VLDRIIVDADFCLKLGCSNKFQFLFEILPLISKDIYMHTCTYGEVMYPESAKIQLDKLITIGKVKLVDQSTLSQADRLVFDMTYAKLEQVMIDPRKPNKNKGETCSLAFAKAIGIPIFATDESSLQPIIDSQLNTGINDIKCLRIENLVEMIRDNEIPLPRKYAKALWRISYNQKDPQKANEIFDKTIWPI